MVIFITLLITAIFYQVYMYFACGGRISKFNEELYSNLDTDKISLHNYQDSTLSLPYGIGKGDKIEKVRFHLYGRYCIDKVGLVKRKSNLDKEIEQYFKTVVDRDNNNRMKNAKKYKKNTNEEPEPSEKPFSPKDEEPVVPTTIRVLLEELRSGKVIHMDGREYKMVEHKEGSIEAQLDDMLRDAREDDDRILRPFKED